MASDNDSGKNLFGRPRRSSFVPPAQANEDFVPILPAVGSTPIPPADAVNYFPPVETGQPSLREPVAPARLVVPSRQSLTEEEIARTFAESGDMSSVEQITLLDAQMTLREADLRTAIEFVETLKTANPREAAPMLDELKVRFNDVDPEIATLTLGDVPVWTEPQTEAVDTVSLVPDLPTSESETVSADLSEVELDEESPVTDSVVVADTGPAESITGRYRVWAAVIALSTIIAALVPLSAAVFTVFGSPASDQVENLISASGVFVLVVALAATTPLVLLARATASRNGLTWRTALQRALGPVSGGIVATVATVFALIGFLVVLLTTSQGVGLQIASIPGVASTLSELAPAAHVTVLVVSALVALGFAISALPRRAFRSVILMLTGFVAVGPALVLITDIIVIANSASTIAVTMDTVVFAMGLVPLALVLLSAVETGAATVVRRDSIRLHGLWLYVGLVGGMAFAAWVLLSGMVGDVQGSVFVGSNPALHVVAATNELAFLIGAISFTVPIVYLASLVGRSLTMTTVEIDSATPNVFLRLGIVFIPVAIFVLDGLGLLADLGEALPGIAFLSVPIMAIVGLMAGSSVASRRDLARWATAVNTTVVVLISLVGLALTTWAVPGLEAAYTSLIAPIASSVGMTGAAALVVPAGVLIVTFVTSLLVSTFGVRRATAAE